MSLKIFFYYFLNQINKFFEIFALPNASKNILLTHIAVNKLTTIQIPSINQNHFIIFTQKIYRMIAIINQVILESHIADQELSNQI
jgi:hemolysin-activating ACP:hemolysin acyltransferase